MPPRCIAANGLWLLSSWPAARAFERDLDRVHDVQEALLRSIVRRNAATEFGRAHGFASIRGVDDWRQRVPIRTWDESSELRGTIEGSLTAERVERYEPTSGSSGPSKRIPYTRTLRRQFEDAIAPWVWSLFRGDPAAFAGEAYWSVSPGGAPDEEILGPVRRRLVRAVQAVPATVRLAEDIDAFRRETLRHLTRCRTLSLISVWHPSFLQLLAEGLDTQALWPRLRVISCWADANAAPAAASLAALFPHARIEAKGLLSTEGFVTIPFDGAPLLAYRSHFFEFRDAETGSDSATELTPGRRYGVILTTGGGLYRYATEDIVEVTGFRGQCPVLRFVGRGYHVSDHFGEKLNEIFVRERLEIALRGLTRDLAMLACDRDGYVLYVESTAPDADLIRAAEALESSLQESHHYRLCRRLGQLRPLRPFRIRGGGSTTYLRARAATQRLGDIKIPALDREQGWSATFDGRFVGSDES